MNTDARTIFRCPYCRGNGGVIAVDPLALSNGQAASVRPDGASHGIDLRRTPGQRVVNFGPDGASPGPCPHAVSFWIEAEAAPGEAEAARRGIDADWKHLWFDGGDPAGCRGDLHAHLWEHLTSEQFQEYCPPVPYLIQHAQVRWDARTSGFQGYALGWYIAAADPAAFFEELRDSERRLQEFWLRPRQSDAQG